MPKQLSLSNLQVALSVAELQVCTATRSPCEDQALPLSWAPPSSAEGGKSPQGQPCCRLQWLRLSTFSAAGRLTEFFREPRHHQMPAEEQRSGGMRSGAHGGLIAPLEKGTGRLTGIQGDLTSRHQTTGRVFAGANTWRTQRPRGASGFGTESQ